MARSGFAVHGTILPFSTDAFGLDLGDVTLWPCGESREDLGYSTAILLYVERP